MKPSSIKRGIEVRRVSGGVRDSASGRSSQLRDPDWHQVFTRKRRRRGESMDSPEKLQRRKLTVVIWSVCFTALTVVLIAGIMLYWLQSQHRRVEGVRVAAPQKVRVASKFPSPSEAESLELVKQALATQDVQNVDRRFHKGSATAKEVVDFIQNVEKLDGRFDRMIWMSSMDEQDVLMEGVVVVYGQEDQQSERLAFLVPDEKGVWKVDFDAFARTCRPSWQAFLKGDAQQAQVRVYAGPDSYYNGPFMDESQWACYAMVAQETKKLLSEEHEILRGYCKVGSPQAKALAKIYGADKRIARTILDLRKMPGAQDGQFEILRVYAEDWVMPPKAFDQRFTE